MAKLRNCQRPRPHPQGKRCASGTLDVQSMCMCMIPLLHSATMTDDVYLMLSLHRMCAPASLQPKVQQDAQGASR